jgi:ring-1,2-phenylacetyl-CoA epoxidase subunit PaaE
MAKFHLLKVSDIRRETADAVSIAFEIPNQLRPDYQFKHGQYITLKLNISGEELRRSYSVCTSPFLENELRVAVKEVKGGRASTFLNRELKKGDTLEVMTPMGNFTTPLSGKSEKNYVLFAGGSGITPVMSILKSILHIEKQSRVTLFYANRDEASEIFARELDSLSANPQFKLVRIYDAPSIKKDDLHTGIVTTEKVVSLLQQHCNISSISEVFICGPGPMMENVKNGLLNLSVPSEKIHIEYFSAVQETLAKEEGTTTIATETTAAVTVIQYGMETSFQLKSSGATILDAALDAGVDVPYSCKGAVCCTCRAKVLEGKVKMDANFALTDGEVAQGFVLTCQAHPLTEKVVVDYDAM